MLLHFEAETTSYQVGKVKLRLPPSGIGA
jgi:hypothetical protein